MGRSSRRAASRQSAVLFAASGLLAVVALLLPGDASRSAFLAVIAADFSAALLIVLLPWHRWRLSATLWITPVAFVIIGLSSAADLIPVRAYGLFFVLVFAWVGVHHPPGTALTLLPLAVVAYSVTLLVDDIDRPLDPRALILAMGIGVLVAETIARGQRAVALANRRAERSAVAFREVARTSAALRHLEPDSVVVTVAAGVMNLGYDGADLSIVDFRTGELRSAQPRGTAVEQAGGRHDAFLALAQQVRASRLPVVVEEYAAHESSASSRSGVGGAVAVPVHVGGVFGGVLIGSTADPLLAHAGGRRSAPDPRRGGRHRSGHGERLPA